MRGITNSSETACHTSSSLQLLYHCFPTLRHTLLELASIASRERRRRQRRRKAKDSLQKEHDHKPFHEEEEEEWEGELVYQLSWFFHLLTHGHDNGGDRSTNHDDHESHVDTSPKILVRKRMKQPLTPAQKRAVQNFMKSSEEGLRRSGDEEWRTLVAAMKEHNRASYEQVLGRVLGKDGVVPSTSAASCSSVDPTAFYRHLTTYTSSVAESHPVVTPIHPSMVGDASSVFRSLCHALEYSAEKEYERVKSRCEMMEVEQWNNDGRGEGGEEKRLRRLEKWKGALEKVGEAVRVEWKGTLLSRIVGTCIVDEGAGWKSQREGGAAKSDEGRMTTTTLRRTKKNGNIERPVPVPFPLPVIQQNVLPQQQQSPPASENQCIENGRRYYPSLIASLYSITIEPSPIRGYDWRGLMKRGEVVEEKLVENRDGVTEEDVLEEDAVMNEARQNGPDSLQKNANNKKVHLEGLAVVQQAQEGKRIKDDNISMASRSIGVQTDFRELEGDVILTPRGLVSQGNHLGSKEKAGSESKPKEIESVERSNDIIMKQEQPPPPPPKGDSNPQTRKPNNFVEKNALYAAAVAAINSSPSKRRGRRISLQRNAPRKTSTMSPGRATFSGIEVGGASLAVANISPMEVGTDLVFKNVTVSSSSSGSVENRLSSDSDSVEESTVNSKVSSVKSHSSNDHDDDSSTHSSAIDTPSDIDELSLGSFTDSADDVTKDNVAPTIPMLDDANEKTNGIETIDISDHVDLSDRSNAITSVDIIQSARSSPSNVSEIADSDGSSSPDPSSDDSSTSSSEISSTESSDTSDDEESSSSDENLSNNMSEAVTPGNDETTDHIVNEQEWVTRKETRFCHPLPQNLIFHLKRFEYSNALGRVDTLDGELHVPNEIDLKPCCLDPSDSAMGHFELNSCCYRYSLRGAVVQVNPIEDEAEKVYGEASEGHYVAFIHASTSFNEGSFGAGEKKWFEIDDDKVRSVDEHAYTILDEDTKQSMSEKQLAMQILSGCDFVSSKGGSCSGVDRGVVKEKERRYATLVVYSRICECRRSRI